MLILKKLKIVKVNAGNGEQSGNGEQMLQFVTKNIYGGCNMMSV